MKLILILACFLSLSIVENPHRDAVLTLDEEGNITGLPEEYGAAKFDLESKYLRIKDKETNFPPCVAYYFDILENADLELTASWYHDKETIPYYINFHIFEESKDYSYNILLNLETLEIIHIKLRVKSGDEIEYNHNLELNPNCIELYNKAIQTKSTIILSGYEKLEENSFFSLSEISKEESSCSRYLVFLLEQSYGGEGETLLFIDTTPMQKEFIDAFKIHEDKNRTLSIGECSRNLIIFSELQDKKILGRDINDFHIGGFAVSFDNNTYKVLEVWPML